MLAKKAVHEDKKAIIRDKEAKILAITDAMQKLIASMGYEKVTIRDIAETADVSVGLIYKYFPGGKFEILVKGLGIPARCQGVRGAQGVELPARKAAAG